MFVRIPIDPHYFEDDNNEIHFQSNLINLDHVEWIQSVYPKDILKSSELKQAPDLAKREWTILYLRSGRLVVSDKSCEYFEELLGVGENENFRPLPQ